MLVSYGKLGFCHGTMKEKQEGRRGKCRYDIYTYMQLSVRPSLSPTKLEHNGQFQMFFKVLLTSSSYHAFTSFVKIQRGRGNKERLNKELILELNHRIHRRPALWIWQYGSILSFLKAERVLKVYFTSLL